jgi:hypothetical protein
MTSYSHHVPSSEEKENTLMPDPPIHIRDRIPNPHTLQVPDRGLSHRGASFPQVFGYLSCGGCTVYRPMKFPSVSRKCWRYPWVDSVITTDAFLPPAASIFYEAGYHKERHADLEGRLTFIYFSKSSTYRYRLAELLVLAVNSPQTFPVALEIAPLGEHLRSGGWKRAISSLG